ncbi:MAG TPA: hypothetical protein VM261_12195 [Kofleriaceae bacterium]|nr:hypothetical protein [Kofleriaceae bacterium]
MSAGGWKRVSAVLGVACAILLYRDCTRPPTARATERDDLGERDRGRGGSYDGTSSDSDDPGSSARRRAAAARTDEPSEDEVAAEEQNPAWSITAPAWVMWLAPQPGENLLHYRDRIVPLAQAAVAPHRSRVARGLDDFSQRAGLNSTQRAELDAAVQEAASTIGDRVLGAALGGDFSPQTFKPSMGVALARDVLDAVDKANRRFEASLREDQRAALAGHPFDVADYLLFSTRWEDMIGAN